MGRNGRARYRNDLTLGGLRRLIRPCNEECSPLLHRDVHCEETAKTVCTANEIGGPVGNSSVDGVEYCGESDVANVVSAVNRNPRKWENSKLKSSHKRPNEVSCRMKCAPHGIPVGATGEQSCVLASQDAAHHGSASECDSHEVHRFRETAAELHLRRMRHGFVRSARQSRSRDPRFSPLHGKLDLGMCSRVYSFLDTDREREMRRLRNIISTGKSAALSSNGKPASLSNTTNAAPEQREAVLHLQQMQSQQAHRTRKTLESRIRSELAKEERIRIACSGKTPHFTSRRKVEQLAKEHLNQGHGLRRREKSMTSRAKKLLQKERKNELIPRRRIIAD